MAAPSSPARRWLPILFWMGVIFIGSSDIGSAAHTGSIVLAVLRWISQGHLSAESMDTIHGFIRKGWHLTEYAILATLLQRAIAVWPLALLGAALYAAGDEYHQSFIPSRTATVHDVLIDTCGASLGLLIFLGVTAYRAKRSPPHPLPDRS